MTEYRPDRRTLLKGAGAGALGVAFGLPILAACSSNDKTGHGTATGAASLKPVRGGTASLAIQGTPVNLDPADAQLYASLQVYQNIFSQLLSIGTDFTYRPNLAAEWRQEDAKTWTFDLVDNAVFHNGEPFTAADVAFTLGRIKTHPVGAFLAYFDKVTAVNPKQVRIQLSRPYGPMEATMATLVDITNEKATKAADPKRNPVGTGPFKLDQWTQGSQVTLSRWDKYFKPEHPYLDGLKFRSVSDPTARLSGLRTGQFDWIESVPPQQAGALASNSDIAHTQASSFLPYFIVLNTQQAPFDDIKVRQAVSWAVDRSEIVKLVFFDAAVEATEPITAPNPWFSGVNPYKGGPDLDKARKLVRDANPSTKDITLLIQTEDPTFATIAQVLQSQLTKIGLTLRIQPASGAEYFGKLLSHQFGMALSFITQTLDPALTYNFLGASHSKFNLSGYKSPRLEAALDKVVFESDQAARKQAYPDLVNAVAEEAPFIFFANQRQQYWSQPKLGGVKVLPNLAIRAEDMWKKT